MEDAMIVTTVVMVAVGILQLTLFFKIWGMCDNVRKLTNHFVKEDTTYENSTVTERTYVSVEGKDIRARLDKRIAPVYSEAEKDIRKMLLKDLEKLCKASVGATEDGFTRYMGVSPEQAISNLKLKYSDLYKKINKPLPKELDSLNCFEDIRKWCLE